MMYLCNWAHYACWFVVLWNTMGFKSSEFSKLHELRCFCIKDQNTYRLSALALRGGCREVELFQIKSVWASEGQTSFCSIIWTINYCYTNNTWMFQIISLMQRYTSDMFSAVGWIWSRFWSSSVYRIGWWEFCEIPRVVMHSQPMQCIRYIYKKLRLSDMVLKYIHAIW